MLRILRQLALVEWGKRCNGRQVRKLRSSKSDVIIVLYKVRSFCFSINGRQGLLTTYLSFLHLVLVCNAVHGRTSIIYLYSKMSFRTAQLYKITRALWKNISAGPRVTRGAPPPQRFWLT